MAFNIAVCVKPVPDPDCYDRITIDPETKTITRGGIPTIVNPVDKNALEAALKLREKDSGTVAVFSMAHDSARENLLELLAMGADRAYLLSDRAFAGSDTLATSYILSLGIRKAEREENMKFDLILCGNESADGATAQVSSQLGEWLGYPHLWNVCRFEEGEGGRFLATTKREDGFIDWDAALPLVLGVSRELNKPRYVSAIGIMKARKKPFAVWGRSDFDEARDEYIGLSGSPTQAGKIFTLDLKRSGREIKGTPAEIAEELALLLKSRCLGTGGRG